MSIALQLKHLTAELKLIGPALIKVKGKETKGFEIGVKRLRKILKEKKWQKKAQKIMKKEK